MEKPTLDKFPRRVLAQIDIQKAFILSRLIVAAERFQIFRVLHGTRMTMDTLGRTLNINKSYLGPFLNVLVALGLLGKSKSTYWNTPFAEKYFIKERSIYWTRQYSRECVDDYESLTLLEKALTTGKRYEAIKRLKKPDYVERMKRDKREAEEFTQMLFHLHQPDAEALAKHVPLSKHRAVLDVAGGSGVMSIALAKKNPDLRACVLDIGPVCAIAARNIREAGLAGRVRTMAGDIRQQLPSGYDVIMFCDVGAVSTQLLRNAHRALPPGGLVLLADRYLNDDGTAPLDRLAEHFAGGGFGLATRADMVRAVKSCGFQQVKARKFYKEAWCITGTKADGPVS